MHSDELIITKELVADLLQNQCQQFTNLKLTAIQSSGTDNTLFKLGEEYIVRLPRVATKSITKEYTWVPQLACLLNTSISEPVFKGEPTLTYPWDWLITKWNSGVNPNFEMENEHALLAQDLAIFLNELHAIKLQDGPISRRGVPLTEVDLETREAIAQLKAEIDVQNVTSLWKKLLAVPAWNTDPVWIHGDLHPGNILVQNNRLAAVIDFSDIGIGDPAADLIVAWSLLNVKSRQIFRDNLVNIDEDTWARGKGWALSMALIILPYYRNTNPFLVALARRILENVISDLT